MQELLPPSCGPMLNSDQLQRLPLFQEAFAPSFQGAASQQASLHGGSGTPGPSPAACSQPARHTVVKDGDPAVLLEQSPPPLANAQQATGNGAAGQQGNRGSNAPFEYTADNLPADPGRQRCTTVLQLIQSWPTEEWCPAPPHDDLEDLVQSTGHAAAAGATVDGPVYLSPPTIAALKSAAHSLMQDEAVIYALCTYSGAGCWLAFCELIWKGDAAYCSMALRLPSPLYSKTTGPFAQRPPNVTGICIPRGMGATYSVTAPVAPFLETMPPGGSHPHTIGAWARRVSKDVVSRQKMECRRVKVWVVITLTLGM